MNRAQLNILILAFVGSVHELEQSVHGIPFLRCYPPSVLLCSCSVRVTATPHDSGGRATQLHR